MEWIHAVLKLFGHESKVEKSAFEAAYAYSKKATADVAQIIKSFDPRWPLAIIASIIAVFVIWKIGGWVVGTPQPLKPKEPEEDKGASKTKQGENGKGANQKKRGSNKNNPDSDGDGSDREDTDDEDKKKQKKGAGPGQPKKKRQQKKKPGAGKREPSPSPQSPPQSDWLAPSSYAPYYSPRY